MSRGGKDKGKLPPFVPVDQEMMRSPAWRAMSYGARWLYVHLKWRWRWRQKNNGRVYISQRDAMEEMGCGHRDSISRWFRELEFYGFIAKTAEGCLGVDGMGKAPQWRLTEAEGPGGRNGDTWSLPTKDYLKWDGTLFEDERGEAKRKRLRKQKPGLESEARAASKARLGLAPKARPLHSATGPESEAISQDRGGLESEAISRLTTRGGAGGRLVKKEQGKVSWSTPILEPVPGDYDRATLAMRISSDTRLLATSGKSNG